MEPLGGGAETDGGGGIVLDGVGEAGRCAEGVGGGEGTAGVVDGGGAVAEGGGGEEAAGGGEEAARVVISSFMPLMQCPPLPQMKYLLPGEVRGMTAAPPVRGGSTGLLAVQESKSGLETSVTSWVVVYEKTACKIIVLIKLIENKSCR